MELMTKKPHTEMLRVVKLFYMVQCDGSFTP